MKIYSKLILDIATGRVLCEDSHNYSGPFALLKGGQSGGGSTETKASIPDEMKPLVSSSAQIGQNLQQQMPLDAFLGPHPEQVANMDINELYGRAAVPYTLNEAFAADNPVQGMEIWQDPEVLAAQYAFEQTGLPLIQNEMATAGLGRSTAMPQSVSMGQAKFIGPAIQGALQRRNERQGRRIGDQIRAIETAMNVGGEARAVQQAGLTAAQQDFLRQQQLAEQINLGPVQDLLPRTIGSTSVSTQKMKGGGK